MEFASKILYSLPQYVKELENQMLEAADNLQFELAAALRDKLLEIKQLTPKSHLKNSKIIK